MVDAITKVVGVFGWYSRRFSHFVGEYIEGSDERTGSYLTAHPGIKAVGFTGSFRGVRHCLILPNSDLNPFRYC
jgi:NADP-dependent aldehyde dehydrogenase